MLQARRQISEAYFKNTGPDNSATEQAARKISDSHFWFQASQHREMDGIRLYGHKTKTHPVLILVKNIENCVTF